MVTISVLHFIMLTEKKRVMWDIVKSGHTSIQTELLFSPFLQLFDLAFPKEITFAVKVN